MPTEFPRRFIGFNAFGLCSDRLLGAATAAPDSPNFFQQLKSGGYPFNVVKVVPFSRASYEVKTGNIVTLYKPGGAINPAFLDNLADLVAAADAECFKVQVCLFHYHAVADLDAAPENSPFIYNPEDNEVRERLRRFFNPTLNHPFKQKQKQLVAEIGQRLAGKTNVLWELANEVRMDGRINGAPVSEQEQIGDNWNLVAWLEQMETALKQAAGSDIQVCTSTGTLAHNEKLTCTKVPTTYFDFHFGQWNEDNRYRHFIEYAKTRASQYAPGHPLVCNDDGAKEPGQGGAVPENTRTPDNLNKWASTAFQMGLGYMLKSSYPSKLPWNTPALKAIKRAHEDNPLPALASAAAEA